MHLFLGSDLLTNLTAALSGYGTVSMSADLIVCLSFCLSICPSHCCSDHDCVCLPFFSYLPACLCRGWMHQKKDAQTKKDVLMMYRCGLFLPSYPIWCWS